MCKVFELASQLNDVIKEINKETETIEGNLVLLDNEILDLYHYIEFTDLDVVRGYKVYKELQTALRSRREYKDAQTLAKKLEETNLASIGLSLDKAMDCINNRGYDARARQDLFDSEIEKNKAKNRSIIISITEETKCAQSYGDVEKAVNHVIASGCTSSRSTIKKAITKALTTDNNTYYGRIWKVGTREEFEELTTSYRNYKNDALENDLAIGKLVILAKDPNAKEDYQFPTLEDAIGFAQSINPSLCNSTPDKNRLLICSAINGKKNFVGYDWSCIEPQFVAEDKKRGSNNSDYIPK